MFARQQRLGDPAQVPEELRHLQTLTFPPLPVKRPTQGRERLIDMWARLVEHLGALPFDLGFNQIERPQIELQRAFVRVRSPGHDAVEQFRPAFGDVGHRFIRGRLITQLGKHAVLKLV